MKAAMDCSFNGYGATTQYALVSYIPDPLGSFLSELRTDLIQGCRLQSHVTILPPRVLSSPVGALIADLKKRTTSADSFEITLGEVEIFPVTNVIYISLGQGKQQVEAMHTHLSGGPFSYKEPFPFHPHATLAQEIPEDSLSEVFTTACMRWANWKGPRRFFVDNLVFVRNVNMRGWETLSEHSLDNSPILRTV